MLCTTDLRVPLGSHVLEAGGVHQGEADKEDVLEGGGEEVGEEKVRRWGVGGEELGK